MFILLKAETVMFTHKISEKRKKKESYTNWAYKVSLVSSVFDLENDYKSHIKHKIANINTRI